MNNQRFSGTERYVATDDLMMAVNAAITLAATAADQGRARHRQDAAGAGDRRARSGGRCYEWHIKSTSKAQQGLYEYDAVSRLRDSQLGDARVHDIGNYILKGTPVGGVRVASCSRCC